LIMLVTIPISDCFSPISSQYRIEITL
jgi:hypothetical protein